MVKFYKAIFNGNGATKGMQVALRIDDGTIAFCAITAGHDCPDDYWVGYLNSQKQPIKGMQCKLKISEFTNIEEIGLYL